MSDLPVLVVDDNVFKAVDIKKALEFNGIRHIIRNQEAEWGEIDKSKVTGNTINLIVLLNTKFSFVGGTRSCLV